VGEAFAKYFKTNRLWVNILFATSYGMCLCLGEADPLLIVVNWAGNYAKIGDRLGVIVDRSGTECGRIVDAFGERRVSGGKRLNGDDNDFWIKQKLQHGWTDSHGFKDKRGLEAKTKPDPFA
jgi:hypothetical protein